MKQHHFKSYRPAILKLKSTEISRIYFATTSFYPFCSQAPLWFSNVRSGITCTKLLKTTQLLKEGTTRNSSKSKPPETIWMFLLCTAHKMQSNFYPYPEGHCNPPSPKFTDPAPTSVHPIFKDIHFQSCCIHLFVHA